MYTLSPEAVASTMPSDTTAHNNRSSDGSIAILLLQDVPEALRGQMVRVQ